MAQGLNQLEQEGKEIFQILPIEHDKFSGVHIISSKPLVMTAPGLDLKANGRHNFKT